MNRNKELGTDNEMLELVARIRGFDHETATPSEQVALAKALRVLADDIVERHTTVSRLEEELKAKLTIAQVTAEIAGVLDVVRPKKKGWLLWK